MQRVEAQVEETGFATAARPGSAAHDELVATAEGIARLSDRAGGTEGGMSTGTVLRVSAAIVRLRCCSSVRM